MKQSLPLYVRTATLTTIITLTAHPTRVNAQIDGQWTWESGANTGGAAAVYGTKGTAAAGNIPGNRDSQSGWADASGNFWIFGGDDNAANTYNDLWKYNPATRVWTWVSGTDNADDAGSYGTKGTAAAGNTPPARFGQHVAVDPSGNFWVFGGATTAALGTTTYLNDLWKYNPSTNLWTWLSGGNSTGASGVYGTKGTAATANVPGGRIYPSIWSDATGNIWVFGGEGIDGAGNNGSLNDLWEYKVTTGKWTWVSGSNTNGATGVYGTKGTAAAANVPGARNSTAGWQDATGNFWIFGGDNGAFFSGGASFNDLWKYSPTTNRWTWVSGDNTSGVAGVYGTEGVAAAANKPGARYGHGVAVDASGDFWLFGGADGGTGNNSYTFIDNQLPTGSLFYRIKAMDIDSSTVYSSIISLGGSNGGLTVYPNPARSSVILQIGDNNLVGTTARLIDLSGRPVGESLITNMSQPIDLSRLPPGVYLLQLSNGASVKVLKTQ
jgi:N-acetylneuraminic acid mutarotase